MTFLLYNKYLINAYHGMAQTTYQGIRGCDPWLESLVILQ